MYGAIGFELFTSGLGTGAFSVLLLRMTQKRFSATQYALFSSLFALPRLLAGPIAGFAVDAMGWAPFFLSTLVMGIPGLVMLARFVPLGVREPEFTVEEVETARRRSARRPSPRAASCGAVLSGCVRVRDGRAARSAEDDAGDAGRRFDLQAAMWQVARPASITDWVQFVGILAFALIGGLFVAAVSAASHGGATAAAAEARAAD